MILYVILIFCYIAGILCYTSDRLSDFAIRREVREMTTKDAWLGLILPILLIWLVI